MELCTLQHMDIQDSTVEIGLCIHMEHILDILMNVLIDRLPDMTTANTYLVGMRIVCIRVMSQQEHSHMTYVQLVMSPETLIDNLILQQEVIVNIVSPSPQQLPVPEVNLMVIPILVVKTISQTTMKRGEGQATRLY